MKIKITKRQLNDIKQAANMYYVNTDASRRKLDQDEFISFCWIKAVEQIIKKNYPEVDLEIDNA